jgi:hypothetical protein
MKTPRSRIGTAVIDDRFIWVFGGINGRGGLLDDSIEVFDAEKNEWSTPPIKLTSPRCGMKAITVDHRIFITDEIFDTDKMTWYKAPEMILLRFGFSAVCF